jgi:hypothetical protein
MALNKKIETRFGITVDDCYMRVEHLSLTKTTMSFHLRNYVTVNKPFFDEVIIECAYSTAGVNPFEQAYAHLKTLPEFVGATDV